MKRSITIIPLLLFLTLFVSPPKAHAQVAIAEIIKEGVKRVVKAVDLMIQRMQNETIALQNAQKWLENKLSELKLTEIAEWTQRQRELYRDYYDKLWRVRNTIQSYRRVAQIVNRQQQMIREATFFRSMVSQDDHFTRAEIDFMYRVYMGILSESLYNIEQLNLIVNSFRTQMSDGERMELIDLAADKIEQNYADLRQFNDQNAQLSLNRAKDAHDAEVIRKIYGLDSNVPVPAMPKQMIPQQ
jgi:hypothetical protein